MQYNASTHTCGSRKSVPLKSHQLLSSETFADGYLDLKACEKEMDEQIHCEIVFKYPMERDLQRQQARDACRELFEHWEFGVGGRLDRRSMTEEADQPSHIHFPFWVGRRRRARRISQKYKNIQHFKFHHISLYYLCHGRNAGPVKNSLRSCCVRLRAR